MIFLLIIWLAICTVSESTPQNVTTNLSLANPSCNDIDGASPGIHCDQSAHDSLDEDPHNRYRNLQSVIQLTSEGSKPYFSRGYVLTTNPVRMLDPLSGQAASFSTSFTFKIVPVNNRSYSGDGIAFVMFANESWRGDPGVTLGVYKGKDGTPYPGTQGTKTLCVEYDTVYNSEVDPLKPGSKNGSDNHVGIDLQNIRSNKTADVSEVGLDLKGGYPLTTWIDYNHTLLLLEVRIANGSQPRPSVPLLSYSLNLSEVVDEYMTPGFASSTGSWAELHELLSWNFSSSRLPGPHRKEELRLSTGEIVGVGVAGLAVSCIFVLGCCTCVWQIRRHKKGISAGGRSMFQYELSVVDMPFRFTYKQLSAATSGFAEASKLGQGGSGSVYRGRVTSEGAPEGAWVAVKKVANTVDRGEKEFMAEISVLSQLRHRNLVKLLGFCSDRERGYYLIVYELMQRGSLDKLLHTHSEDVLSWAQRVAIVRGVAAGLSYLHIMGTSKQVIHRDIKSSNVMLDEDYKAKLGDFGLARMVDHFIDASSMHDQQGDVGLARMADHYKDATSIQLAGTFGYMAPEIVEGKCADKSDVYAFGVLILEIASSRRPIDSDRCPDDPEMMLLEWVWTCHMKGDIAMVADPRLEGCFCTEEMAMLLKLGLLCSHTDPEKRPSMPYVELILAGHKPLPDVPRVKPTIEIPFVKEMMKRRNPHGVSRSTNTFGFLQSGNLSGSAGGSPVMDPPKMRSIDLTKDE